MLATEYGNCETGVFGRDKPTVLLPSLPYACVQYTHHVLPLRTTLVFLHTVVNER